MNIRALKALDVLSEPAINTLNEAKQFALAARHASPDELLLTAAWDDRLAAAELAVAQDDTKAVSTKDIAEAFDLLADALQVQQSDRIAITPSAVAEFALKLSAAFPFLMRNTGRLGLRPISAIVTLRLLLYNAGLHKPGEEPRSPRPGWRPSSSNRQTSAYQRALSSYLRGHSSGDILNLADKVMVSLKI